MKSKRPQEDQGFNDFRSSMKGSMQSKLQNTDKRRAISANRPTKIGRNYNYVNSNQTSIKRLGNKSSYSKGDILFYQRATGDMSVNSMKKVPYQADDIISRKTY